MEISEVRQRLLQTIDRAKRQAAERLVRSDEAARQFDRFLNNVAVPLFRQAANVLRAEGYLFNLFTPSGSVRLMSDRTAEDFIEVSLDSSVDPPQVMGHSSRSRGRRVVEAERALGDPEALTDDDLLEYLSKELEPFVER
jgi:hypothetical protein